MRLQIFSDLHTELHRDQGASFVKSMTGEDVDVLVLAGDIFSLKNDYWPIQHLSALTSRYQDIIYTPGNHELYGTSPSKAEEKLLRLEQLFPHFHVLRLGQPKIVQGQRFIGGTLWFRDDPLNILHAHNLSDFSQIKGFVPWVYDLNKATIHGLESNLQTGDIMVTHHLPSHQSVAPRFRGDALNRFFVCDLEQLILDRQPAVCIHGHSHDPVDYMIGPTRVASNPLGYLHEKKPPLDYQKYVDL